METEQKFEEEVSGEAHHEFKVDEVAVLEESSGVSTTPETSISGELVESMQAIVVEEVKQDEAPMAIIAHQEEVKSATDSSTYPPDVTFACLIYTTENNGELYIQWSQDEPIAKCLGFFMTKKKIPAFKLKKPVPLATALGFNHKKYVGGVATFFKECDAYDGVFRILDRSNTGFGDVWVSVGGKKWGKEPGVPRKIQDGEDVDINSIEAAVILPHNSAVFDGVLKLDINRFVNTGIREGAAWHRS